MCYLREEVAARRDAKLSAQNNGPTCPTVDPAPSENIGQFSVSSNLKKPRPATGFGRLISIAHGAVCRDLGFVLTLADREAWRGFSTVLRARLAPEERSELARAAVLACDDNDLVTMIGALAGSDGAGPPIPTFDGVAEEARSWAEYASDAELKAYAVACVLRMSPSDRAAFLAFVERRAAA